MRLIAVTLLLIFAAGFQATIAQDSADLSSLKISIVADKQPLGIIFRKLMLDNRIHIGFEQSSLDNGKWHFAFDTNLPFSARHKTQNNGGTTIETTAETGFSAGAYPISLDVKNGSVRDVFDAIVRQMDHYSWDIRDGVINIFPIRGRDPRFEKLLDLRIEAFHLPKGSKVEEITVSLLNLPEFRQFRRSHRLSFFPVREGVTVLIEQQYGRTIDQPMEFKNISLRDLLNNITKIKKGGWILRMRGKTREGGDRADLDI